ncbi:MAG: sigma-70 family RNA polymerase sigma factor [Melioribacteraceae bacterium]|jgi:RNA polymerase sigma factor for flagellar operon FliA|nr:RNA polymerase subunit sigma [Ignavibacteriota bacterium]MBZ0182634.1 sigma-70 family RNA polymerase sigma factor [Melioribacteraceae bacterium]
MNNSTLWAEYKKEQNPSLKKKIIINYSNLVHYVIHHSKFINLNVVDEKDFFQFGIEGLSEAIDRFDPDFGTKFETYAIQRIRGKIIDELRKLQIKPRTQSSENAVPFSNVSLNNSIDKEDGYLLYEVIPSDAETPVEIADKSEEKELLVDAIKQLNERDRLIISLYYYENLNYREIADILKITVSRVSQIHSKVLKDLKQILEKNYNE